MYFVHYSLVPSKLWRWKYFKPVELASGVGKGGEESLLINVRALDKLERARELIGKPFVINSAYRAPIYNAKVGGAPLSAHKEGHAFDISLKGHDRKELLRVCREVGFTGFGLYNTFLHVDLRKYQAQWGIKEDRWC